MLLLNYWQGGGNGPARGCLTLLLPSRTFSLQNQARGRSCRRPGEDLQGTCPRSRVWAAASGEQRAPTVTAAAPSPPHPSALGFLCSHAGARPSENEAHSACSSAVLHGSFIKGIKISKQINK